MRGSASWSSVFLELTLAPELEPKLNHPPLPPPLDRNALAAAILLSLDQSFPLISNHFDKIIAWASSVDYLRGRTISASLGATTIEGAAQGIDREGALLIRTNEGAITRLTSGEVTRFSLG